MLVEQLREQAGFSPIECSIADYFLEVGDALHDRSARSIAGRHVVGWRLADDMGAAGARSCAGAATGSSGEPAKA